MMLLRGSGTKETTPDLLSPFSSKVLGMTGHRQAVSSGDIQMSGQRKKLQEALCRYTTDTLTYIKIVSGFCQRISKWIVARETELTNMKNIKENADKIKLNISHVTQSENKGKAMGEFLKSKVTQVTADSRRAKLEGELAAVLADTLGGLKKLDCFLDAVEKLAVTSLPVFMEENQALHLSEGISLKQVWSAISAAREICPLLLEFKRDANVFFLARLQNVEVLAYQLAKYIQTTQIICDKLEKRQCFQRITSETKVDLDVDLSEGDVQRILCHINQLQEIRMNQHFRMVFSFQKVSCSVFINQFSLTMTGVGLGITSGVNSAVTTATEIGVNRKQQKKASEAFQSFMEDVQALQDCLEEVTSQTKTKIGGSDTAPGAAGKGIGAFAKSVSAAKLLKSEVLALSKSARAGFVAVNALFVGMDIFFICKDSISLSKGSEAEVSQFIRARAALWSSEMDSWQKIHDSLCEGQQTSEENKAVLDKHFYPGIEKI
uniref:uncharacterized protein LOC124073666 isoform X3 n=1 Tax=Scatophagus argus TaxID=75038 RepID=UPI001ED84437|nr:uncharacterized protein LOC124073666 isoform X3 [Scatophagus argus]